MQQYDDDFVGNPATPEPQAPNWKPVSFDDPNAIVKSGIDRLAPTKDRAIRFAVIPGCIQVSAWHHFIDTSFTSEHKEKGGYKICNSVRDRKNNITRLAPCCAAFESSQKSRAKNVVAVMVLRYDGTDNLGRYGNKETIPTFDLGWIRFAAGYYRDVQHLPPEDKQVEDVDLLMSALPDTFGYAFTVINHDNKYKLNPDAFKDLEADADPYRDGTKLAKKLGLSMTDAEWRVFLRTVFPTLSAITGEILGSNN